MGEFLKSYKGEDITRRSLIKGTVKTATALGTLGLLRQAREGVKLNPNEPNRLTPATAQELRALSRDNIITIAKRAGNNINELIKAARAGIDYADADLNKRNGALHFYHGRNFGLFRVDDDEKAAGLGPPLVTARLGFELASQQGIGLVIELKRGDFEPQDVEKLYGWAQDLKVSTFMFSRIYEEAEMIRSVVGNKVAIHAPQNPSEWRRFFRDQDSEEKGGVLTDSESIQRYHRMLGSFNLKVLVGNVTSAQKVLELQQLKVVNGYMSKTKVLSSIFPSDIDRVLEAMEEPA